MHNACIMAMKFFFNEWIGRRWNDWTESKFLLAVAWLLLPGITTFSQIYLRLSKYTKMTTCSIRWIHGTIYICDWAKSLYVCVGMCLTVCAKQLIVSDGVWDHDILSFLFVDKMNQIKHWSSVYYYDTLFYCLNGWDDMALALDEQQVSFYWCACAVYL